MSTPDLKSDLHEYGAVLFGNDNDTETQRQVSELGGSQVLGDQGVHFVACNGSGKSICEQAGIRTLPTLVLGGAISFEGVHSAQEIREQAAVPGLVAQALQSAGAKLFGSRDCIWTARQLIMFGPHVTKLPYVECGGDAPHPSACSSISSVPTWEFTTSDGLTTRMPGYQSMASIVQAAGLTEFSTEE